MRCSVIREMVGDEENTNYYPQRVNYHHQPARNYSLSDYSGAIQ
jgi:hypothetical protein